MEKECGDECGGSAGGVASVGNRNPRLIARLGLLLVSQSGLVSVLCCLAGLLSILLLPILAKNTYISENALMPGSANSMFSYQDVKGANKLIEELLQLKPNKLDSGIGISRIIAEYMTATGSDVYYHEFHPSSTRFHPLDFFSRYSCAGVVDESGNFSSSAINVVGIVRAPQGDGKEAIVLVTPYNSKAVKETDALLIGLAYSIFYHLSQVSWLAKDIIWLAADSRYGEYASVSSWLRTYYDPIFGNPENGIDTSSQGYISNARTQDTVEEVTSRVFKRAGAMAAAVVIKIVDASSDSKDTVQIYAEASNGQMPNLDLINVIHYLAVHRQGLHVKVGMISSLLNSSWLKLFGDLLEWLSYVAGSVNPQWRFGISASDFLEGTATLASSICQQALGIPTGPHGAFRDYQVDAVTLEISPKVVFNNDMSRSVFLLKIGRLVEGIVRSVNNLLEKFHQSFFLYLLTAPDKFVSVGVYMIPFAVLIVPFPVLAAALYLGKASSDFSSAANLVDCSNTSEQIDDQGPPLLLPSCQWLYAAKTVLLVHAWAAIFSMLPFVINRFIDGTSTVKFCMWVILSALLLLLNWYSFSSCQCSMGNIQKPHVNDWALLKAATVGFAFIGLGLMSVINFATAQVGTILLVPMCLVIHPIKHIFNARKSRSITLMVLNLLFGVLGFPPASFLLLKGISSGFDNVGVGDFWDWAETLWSWNSATYLYLMLVQLPCWVLCLHILLHP